jgi:hypothetical protein
MTTQLSQIAKTANLRIPSLDLTGLTPAYRAWYQMLDHGLWHLGPVKPMRE